MAVDTPVDPFGATAKGAADLVPEARLLTAEAPAGKYGVTEAQVEAWVREVTSTVAMRLDGWEHLSNTPVLDDTGAVVIKGDRDRLAGSARTVVHNGAASYLEAARHPERAAVNDTSYAAVLWDRYRTGLEDLVGWLTARLAKAEADDTPTAYAGGPAYSFPPPLFGDALRF